MATFHSRHARSVYFVALRVPRVPSAAEDVLQQVFMQVWRKLAEYIAIRGKLAARLSVVLQNRAVDVLLLKLRDVDAAKA